VFALVTRGDWFSAASLEAMALGLPVVTSPVGGIAEIVEPSQSAPLVPAGAGAELRAPTRIARG